MRANVSKILFPILILVLSIVLLACAKVKAESNSKTYLSPMKTTVLKVGKADAIILQCGDFSALIDAGEEDDGKEVVEFLGNSGIRRLDLMIITHYDKDHVGGADMVVENVPVDRVLLPAYEGTSTEYLDFVTSLKEKDIIPLILTSRYTETLGEMSFDVEPPASYETDGIEGEFDNNFSLITTVTHGDNVLLFAADMEKHRIREWLQNGTEHKADFLKVPHHGVYNGALEELFTAVSPQVAVICDSAKNPAEADTLALLKKTGAKIYETQFGTISVLSDGKRLEVRQLHK